ncbi:hypothetical protein [Aliarcobacter butzleri]|uniref:hypothetical protein n=1 Tax=Aliarcobacter butzleri TaxID=28197 RepID=UPI002B24760E|nr:hypothetical protein [Aliarcobacter butzleri]
MSKYLFLILLLFSLNLFADKEVFISCFDTESQYVKLVERETKIHKKDDLKTIIYFDKSLKKFYLNSNDGFIELKYLGNSNGTFQFLEPTLLGNYIFYSYHSDHSILTIQKSIGLFSPSMISIIQKCKL